MASYLELNFVNFSLETESNLVFKKSNGTFASTTMSCYFSRETKDYIKILGGSVRNVHEKDKDTDRSPYALGYVVHTMKVKVIVV